MLLTFDIIILFFAASVSIFAISMIAHVQKCLEWFDRIRVVVFFSLFPAMLFYIGLTVAALVKSVFPEMGMWMMVLMLLILGVRYILKAFKMKIEKRFFDYTKWRVLFALSIALGMDYLILGLGFKFVPFHSQIVLILLMSFAVLSIVTGMLIGKRTGKFEWGNRMLYLGGLLFIGMAVKFSIQLLHLI